ncbi:hypothetical protein SODALDRAFT_357716 [Sodiomyces alkalinus F11]|uniref:Uncharacterized protein n=1 Tax=Sodiomyces alkalinus (strain CBS 110278 / VKM F-3762 / F11) TaxID=1314773 RepID=A0A3N2Q4F6_SODAK|nr:hypothetical protein SODALDRAFT_357716 [Sodiomyces alkalinus F11]ROT41650.1 hypothetical protein SODALDRAFT_357716 [Sodiomyces alkalinus F11]
MDRSAIVASQHEGALYPRYAAFPVILGMPSLHKRKGSAPPFQAGGKSKLVVRDDGITWNIPCGLPSTAVVSYGVVKISTQKNVTVPLTHTPSTQAAKPTLLNERSPIHRNLDLLLPSQGLALRPQGGILRLQPQDAKAACGQCPAGNQPAVVVKAEEEAAECLVSLRTIHDVRETLITTRRKAMSLQSRKALLDTAPKPLFQYGLSRVLRLLRRLNSADDKNPIPAYWAFGVIYKHNAQKVETVVAAEFTIPSPGLPAHDLLGYDQTGPGNSAGSDPSLRPPTTSLLLSFPTGRRHVLLSNTPQKRRTDIGSIPFALPTSTQYTVQSSGLRRGPHDWDHVQDTPVKQHVGGLQYNAHQQQIRLHSKAIDLYLSGLRTPSRSKCHSTVGICRCSMNCITSSARPHLPGSPTCSPAVYPSLSRPVLHDLRMLCGALFWDRGHLATCLSSGHQLPPLWPTRLVLPPNKVADASAHPNPANLGSSYTARANLRAFMQEATAICPSGLKIERILHDHGPLDSLLKELMPESQQVVPVPSACVMPSRFPLLANQPIIVPVTPAATSATDQNAKSGVSQPDNMTNSGPMLSVLSGVGIQEGLNWGGFMKNWPHNRTNGD